MAKTVNEHRTENLSHTLSDWGFLELKTEDLTLSGSRQTLSDRVRHCLVGGL
jgi:hypothetical protein